jgi:short-subunit dehydrogenase
MKLQGKLALVTGASSGIGAATARGLASRGARLVLVARSESNLARVADEIRAQGGEAHVFPTDLADPDAIRTLAHRVTETLGAPDILLNNAGAGRWLSLLDTTPDEAARMMALPYLAAFNLTRECLPAMLARKSGRIVNVTSAASRLAWPGATAYIAARRAMDGFHAGLSAELLGTGIGATLVVLGTVETPYWQNNPGSREHLPPARGVRELSAEQAAHVIMSAIERDRHRVVAPGVFRLLFALGTIAPRATERMLATPTGGEARAAPPELPPSPRGAS